MAKVWVRDIRRVHSKEIKDAVGDVDIIIASPPCEAFTTISINIMKDPLDRLYTDPRGRLILEAIRIIGDLKPLIFIIENVPGILISPIPHLLRKEFRRIGYSKVFFNILNAADYNTPSFRRRVFISNIMIKPIKNNSRVTVEKALEDLPDPRYPCNIPNHIYVKPPKRFQGKIGRLGWNKALDYFRGGNLKEYKQFMRLHPFKLAPTIMGRSRFIHPFEDRIITVREEARLMGYPDTHLFYGNLDKQFNQVGESVPPSLARAIAEYILKEYLN